MIEIRSKRSRLILNEIKWRYDLDRCRVHYIHRGAPGDTKIAQGSEIKEIGKGFLILEGVVHEVYIPYHRIFRIDYEDQTIFDRKRV